jgi:hypothetical protein
MNEPAARPLRRESPRRQGRAHPAPAATVGLITAARVLGISPDEAHNLAKHGDFPCNVIEASDGYRVSFTALLRVLRPGPARNAAG